MVEKYFKHNIYQILMKQYCLYFDKKIQKCILHSPLQKSYLKKFVISNTVIVCNLSV